MQTKKPQGQGLSVLTALNGNDLFVRAQPVHTPVKDDLNALDSFLGSYTQQLKHDFEELYSEFAKISQTKDDRIRDLMTQLRQYEVDEENHGSYEQLVEDKARLSMEVKGMQMKLKQRERELASARSELLLCRGEMDALRSLHDSEVLDLRGAVVEAKSLANHASMEKQSIVSELVSDLQTAKDSVVELKRQSECQACSVKQRDIDSQKMSIERLKSLLKDACKQCQEANEEIPELSNRMDEAMNRAATLEMELKKVVRERDDCAQERDGLLQRVNGAAEEYNEMVRPIQERLDQLQQRIDEGTEENLSLLKEKEKLVASLSESQRQLQESQNQVFELADEVSSRTVAMEAAAAEHERTSAVYEEMVCELKNVQKHNQEFERKLADADKQMATLTSLVNGLQSSCVSANTEKDRLQAECDRLESQHQESTRAARDARAQLDEHAAQLASLQAAYNEAEQELSTMKQQRSRVTTSIRALRGELSSYGVNHKAQKEVPRRPAGKDKKSMEEWASHHSSRWDKSIGMAREHMSRLSEVLANSTSPSLPATPPDAARTS